MSCAQGAVQERVAPPFHPYTRLLINSVPEMRIGWLEEAMQKQDVTAGIARGVDITAIGCPFYERCPLAIEGTCNKDEAPILEPHSKHFVACHRQVDELMEQTHAVAAEA